MHLEKLREEESQFLEYPFKGSYSNHDQSVEVKHHEISDVLSIRGLLQCMRHCHCITSSPKVLKMTEVSFGGNNDLELVSCLSTTT